MIKLVGLLRRNPQLTHDEFVDYWKTVHSPLIRKTLPGLVKYSASFPVTLQWSPEAIAAGLANLANTADFDAIVELGFESVESMTQAMSSPSFLSEERQLSSARLSNLEQSLSLVMEEVVVPLP